MTPTFPAYTQGSGIVAVSGIAALDPATMTPVAPDFAAQARWVLARLEAILRDVDARPLRVECFLADRHWFPAWNEAFADHFGPNPPARTTMICGLPVDGLLIEIQVIAAT